MPNYPTLPRMYRAYTYSLEKSNSALFKETIWAGLQWAFWLCVGRSAHRSSYRIKCKWNKKYPLGNYLHTRKKQFKYRYVDMRSCVMIDGDRHRDTDMAKKWVAGPNIDHYTEYMDVFYPSELCAMFPTDKVERRKYYMQNYIPLYNIRKKLKEEKNIVSIKKLRRKGRRKK